MSVLILGNVFFFAMTVMIMCRTRQKDNAVSLDNKQKFKKLFKTANQHQFISFFFQVPCYFRSFRCDGDYMDDGSHFFCSWWICLHLDSFRCSQHFNCSICFLHLCLQTKYLDSSQETI